MPVIDTYILVPHLFRYVPWFAVRDTLPNTIDTQPPRCLHDRYRNFIDCSTPASRLRRSASVWTRDRMHGMIQTEAMPFIFFLRNCLLNSKLRSKTKVKQFAAAL